MHRCPLLAQVSKVAGNFHIAPGRSYEQGAMHVHDLAPFQGRKLDFSHTVNSLSFGQQFPGMRNPLDKAKAPPGEGPHGDEAVVGAFSYFLKVVPTIYTPLKGGEVHTNQYSVTEHFRASASAAPGGHALPGLFFSYELSPIKIKISEVRGGVADRAWLLRCVVLCVLCVRISFGAYRHCVASLIPHIQACVFPR